MSFEAHLFTNGNAMFFDSDGEQLPKYQKLGWKGLHPFMVDYPDAHVFLSHWHDQTAIMVNEPDLILEQIEEPNEDIHG